MYKVVSDFRDAKNDNHLYRVGDEYPVAGYKPSKSRIEELAKGKNKFGKVFIEELAKGKNKFGKVFIEEAPVNPAEGQTPDPENGEGEPEPQTEE